MRLVKVLLVSHLKEFAVAKLSVQRQNFGIGVISRLPFEGNPKPPYSAVGAFGSIAPSGGEVIRPVELGIASECQSLESVLRQVKD